MNGAGAAGIAIAKHLLNMGVKNITLCDSKGIICKGDERLNAVKREMAEITNLEHMTGTLADAMKGADVFLGISAAGCVIANIPKKNTKKKKNAAKMHSLYVPASSFLRLSQAHFPSHD